MKKKKKIVPKEETRELGEPMLTNCSSEETEFDLKNFSSSAGNSDDREIDRSLTGGGGGTIGKKNFSKSKEARLVFSMMSSLRADSACDSPFFLRNSRTVSTLAMNATRRG